MDLGLSRDPYESYRLFQSRIIHQYELMKKRENFAVIDATLGIQAQQKIMRRIVLDKLGTISEEVDIY